MFSKRVNRDSRIPSQHLANITVGIFKVWIAKLPSKYLLQNLRSAQTQIQPISHLYLSIAVQIKRNSRKLTDAGRIEVEQWLLGRHSPLAGDRTGRQTDDAPVLPVHEAQPAAVPVGLGPRALGPRGRPAWPGQRRGYHELRALRVEPAPVARVGCERAGARERDRDRLFSVIVARGGQLW